MNHIRKDKSWNGRKIDKVIGELIEDLLNHREVMYNDVYDAMSTDRVYRKRLMPQEVVEYIRDQAQIHFDPKLSRIFLENIALFTIGSTVLLNSGEKGIVMKVTPKNSPARPVVRIIFDKDGHLVKETFDRDLKKDLTLFILKTLPDDAT
jgi:hypothetical protein